MKFRQTQRILIVLAVTLFTSTTAISQSILQQNPSPEIEEMAQKKSEMWKDELSLTTKQTDLIEKKLIEFAIKKDRLLQSKMREEAKTERLLRLQALENKDMRDILTGPQYERYIILLEKQLNRTGSR